MKQFDITYYHGPYANFIIRDDIVAEIAASGMTLVPLTYDTETNKKALRVLRHYGLRAYILDPRIREVYYNDDLAGADAVAKEVVADYAEFDNVIGWEIVDEPSASSFPVLSAIVQAFRRYSPDKETIINLFPNYAVPEQLGNPDYRSHLEAFVNIVNPHLISYDHYHFLGRENRTGTMSLDIADERERLIRLAAEKTEDRAGFFENIEDIRDIANKYEIDPMLIVLLSEHGSYRNLTRAELFWEVNMCLAYGMKRISYFTYWGLPYDDAWRWANAMCNIDGSKCPHWFDAQAINAQIKPAGRHLFNTKSKAVFHIGDAPEPGTKLFERFDTVASIDGQNGVIGFFEDGSIYLVNRDFQNENTFTLHTDAPLTVMNDGGIFVKLENNTITLGAGEAILLHA